MTPTCFLWFLAPLSIRPLPTLPCAQLLAIWVLPRLALVHEYPHGCSLNTTSWWILPVLFLPFPLSLNLPLSFLLSLSLPLSPFETPWPELDVLPPCSSAQLLANQPSLTNQRWWQCQHPDCNQISGHRNQYMTPQCIKPSPNTLKSHLLSHSIGV